MVFFDCIQGFLISTYMQLGLYQGQDLVKQQMCVSLLCTRFFIFLVFFYTFFIS